MSMISGGAKRRAPADLPLDAAAPRRLLGTRAAANSDRALRAAPGSERRLRVGRVFDAFLCEAGLGGAVQLLVRRGGVAGGLRVLLALAHEARQGGARELLFGRGLLAARPRRQRARRIKRQRDTHCHHPHDFASLAVSISL